MTTKSWFSDEECRAVGFSPPMIETLKKVAALADTIDRLGGLEETVDVVEEDLEDAALSIFTLDSRLDVLEDDAPYVSQDQTLAWVDATGTPSRATFATYAGQIVSNPPTQAEVQAIDDHVKLLSQRVAALVNDLRSIGALT